MVIELPSLYQHQTEIVDGIRAAMKQHRRVILEAGTGVGKSRMAKWLMASCLNRTPAANQSGRACFAVHRRGLVDNIIGRMNEEPGLTHGVIMSQRETEWGCRAHVASIDTMMSWMADESGWRTDLTYDLFVVDETHSHFSKFKAVIELHDLKRVAIGKHPAYVVGLSATPQFKGNSWYGTMVHGPKGQWLIDNGYSSKFRYMAGHKGRLDKLVGRGGEFTKDSIHEAFDGLEGNFVRDYMTHAHAENRATVGFFQFRSHAQEAQRLLQAEGVKCEYVDANTSDEMRLIYFDLLNEGRIDYIANVGIVDRGIDIPRISCVQLCTAMKSLPSLRQKIGRGSRVHPAKTETLVLDHGGNLIRHSPYGFFEVDVPWVIENTEAELTEIKERSAIQCPNPGCGELYMGGKCPHCGYTPTPKERAAEGLEFDGRDLVELKPTTDVKPFDCQAVLVSKLFAAGRAGRTWSQCLAWCYSEAEKVGQRFRVPATVHVAGHDYPVIPRGSPHAHRRISATFPWTVGKWRDACWDMQEADSLAAR